MKTIKILLVAFAASVTAFTAKADNDKPIAPEALPANTQQFIQKYFGNKEISYAKMDTDFMDKSYEVFFVDGCKAEFDKKGDWKEVSCRTHAIPAGIVPSQIEDFVAKNQPNQAIVKIDKDKRDYELKLQNGLEMKFDLSYKFLRYDD